MALKRLRASLLNSVSFALSSGRWVGARWNEVREQAGRLLYGSPFSVGVGRVKLRTEVGRYGRAGKSDRFTTFVDASGCRVT